MRIRFPANPDRTVISLRARARSVRRWLRINAARSETLSLSLDLIREVEGSVHHAAPQRLQTAYDLGLDPRRIP